MQSLVNAVTQSVLTRFLANIFLFLFLCAALGIAAYQIIVGAPVNTAVLSVLNIGAGSALALLGINHGSTMTPTSTTPPASSTVPSTTPIATVSTTVATTPSTPVSSMQGH